MRSLREHHIRTAVVTSSVNGALVLETAGIAHLFDTRVDGNDIVQLGLRGKPAPDAFLEAARRLGAEARRAVVVEDAISGVAGGTCRRVRPGHRCRSHRAVASAARGGAHEVVSQLGQVQVTPEPPSAWSLVYEGFDPAREGMREALCALGNGYFGVRGAAPWASADGVHYPGTYLAGGYNRLRTSIAGRVVENEDLVNLPNALLLTFRIGEDDWFDLRAVKF